jgi:uncharacterized membrane protein YfcA
MKFLYFLISFLATGIGGICGIGGGVIIKPVLDATGMLSVSGVSFLSGCTVLSMSVISVLRNQTNRGIIDMKTSTPLAIGAVAGGIVGKSVFELLKALVKNENYVGSVQAGLLILVTLGSLLYSIYASRIHTHQIENAVICLLIGLALGMVSTFLGIGGGPINLTVLFFFFSMDTKKATANSLYIIMFSQFAGLLQLLVTGHVPPVGVDLVALMTLAGVLGGLVGNRVNARLSSNAVDRLFIGLMAVIIGISSYNLYKFIFLA